MRKNEWLIPLVFSFLLSGMICLLFFLHLSRTGIALLGGQTRVNDLDHEIRGLYFTGQSVEVGHVCLKAISVKCATYRRKNFSPYQFTVKDKGPAQKKLLSLQFRAQTVKDNHFNLFLFPACLAAPSGILYFELSSLQAKASHTISVWFNNQDEYASGQRYSAGVPAGGDLAFRLYTSLSFGELLSRMSSLRPGIWGYKLIFPLLFMASILSVLMVIVFCSKESPVAPAVPYRKNTPRKII